MLGEVNVTYTNGQSMTVGYFYFVMQPSYINGGLKIEQQVYVEQFEDLANMIKNQSGKIDEDVVVMIGKLGDISQQIKDNDIVTKPEFKDTTGDLGIFRQYDKEIMEKMKNEFEERGVNARWFGVIPDSDVTQTLNNALRNGDITLPPGNYQATKIHIPNNSNLLGIGKPIINLSLDKDPVLAGIGSFSSVINFHFKSTEKDLEWSRFDVSNRRNVKIKRCNFEGFLHNSTSQPNSWGIYLDKSKQIEIKDCGFAENGLSDIAIVGGCENIIIDKCFNIKDFNHGISIDIEPNEKEEVTRNVKISNMTISELTIWENNFTYDGTENILVENCLIKDFVYNGGNIEFKNCKIEHITTQKTQDKKIYQGGKVIFNNSINVGNELLKSTKITDFSLTKKTFWSQNYISGPLKDSLVRIKQGNIFLTKIGNNSIKAANTIKAMFINDEYEFPVEEGDQFIFSIKGYGNVVSDSAFKGCFLTVSFQDLSKKSIKQSTFKTTTTPNVGQSDYNTFNALITVDDPNIKFIRIILSNGGEYSNGEVYIENVSFRKLFEKGLNSKINVNDTLISFNPAQDSLNFFKGEQFRFLNPADYIGVVYTADNVWKKYGKIE
ncbi:hypothetical protein CBF37_11230 [Vagococcus vulneris]|uniref:Uncharacterized protein n=1 Tax=Vagococcus vulneris TaxID=1977869 RepID=A0A429ZR19_9ENTE|nr:hypothetical protein CBF37_11230 [Vagococcus vulneris]